MEKHNGNIRGFVHLSRAWYGAANLERKDEVVDSVSFGYYSPDGGTTGEMTVTWQILSGKVVPCLKVWDDAWDALYRFQDVLKEMRKADDLNIDAEEFCNLLKHCGLVDMTEEEAPAHLREA